MVVHAPQEDGVTAVFRKVGICFGSLQHDHVFQAAPRYFFLDSLKLFLIELRGVNSAVLSQERTRRKRVLAISRTDVGDGLTDFPTHGLGEAGNLVTRLRRCKTKKNSQQRRT